MSIQALVYLASIIDNVRAWLGVLIAAIVIGNVIFALNRAGAFDYCGTAKPFLWKIHLPVWVFAALLGFVISVIPSGGSLYKIAGVTEQQKAAIDAAGRIVK